VSYVVDTNLLTRSVEKGHPQQQISYQATNELLQRGEILCVLAQSLYEFWVVATRPLVSNGLGLDVTDTLVRLSYFEELLEVKLDKPEVFTAWKQLVVNHSVKGKPAHDARIAAAMQVHGLTHLLTFNGADFKRYGHITVVTPDEIVYSAT
jgi:predicted nucleic acid-binding protein